MAAAIPLVAAAVPAVLKGIEGLAGDPHKVDERNAAIQQLQQEAAQGNTQALDTLESWATGGQIGGVASRSDEPNASRQTASQALQALGLTVPAVTTGGGSSGSGTSGSVVPAVAGAAAGAASGSGVTGALAGAGIGEAAQEYANQQSLYNQALSQQQGEYNQAAPLRAQGVQSMENAMASPPDLSSVYAAPSNPFSHSAPVSGTPVPGISATSPTPSPSPTAPTPAPPAASGSPVPAAPPPTGPTPLAAQVQPPSTMVTR